MCAHALNQIHYNYMYAALRLTFLVVFVKHSGTEVQQRTVDRGTSPLQPEPPLLIPFYLACVRCGGVPPKREEALAPLRVPDRALRHARETVRVRCARAHPTRVEAKHRTLAIEDAHQVRARAPCEVRA